MDFQIKVFEIVCISISKHLAVFHKSIKITFHTKLKVCTAVVA